MNMNVEHVSFLGKEDTFFSVFQYNIDNQGVICQNPYLSRLCNVIKCKDILCQCLLWQKSSNFCSSKQLEAKGKEVGCRGKLSTQSDKWGNQV